MEVTYMIKEAIVSFIMGTIASVVLTSIVVGLLIGEAGIPVSVMGNNITAVICGGLSGFVTTILTWKKHKLDKRI
jgi:hypothetical protein